MRCGYACFNTLHKCLRNNFNWPCYYFNFHYHFASSLMFTPFVRTTCDIKILNKRKRKDTIKIR